MKIQMWQVSVIILFYYLALAPAWIYRLRLRRGSGRIKAGFVPGGLLFLGLSLINFDVFIGIRNDLTKYKIFLF